uniref:uncharacterized protein LOC101304653 n=1 Tax=Fragaria vesca subsp. vesca TaxID=101020 RepID=UPI0005C87D30|nr:PREDICTED: uncharacterized protein LOC101304653 [Fragaria vesca subsp. vesca]
MHAAMAVSTISLRLLIDIERQKVLFAEASKDFVDFLFTLLSLPVATVIRLLSEDGMVGSFGKLYESVEDLDFTYMPLDKDILLKPKAPFAGPNILGLLADVDEPAATNKVFYMCSDNNSSSNSNKKLIKKSFPKKKTNKRSSCYVLGYTSEPNCSGSTTITPHLYVTEDPNQQCPQCNHIMSSQVIYVDEPKTIDSGAGVAGYVKGGLFTYMIMDDLEVKPISSIGTLEEKAVDLGMNEGLRLLKESLQSKSVLSNVFLEKQAAS